MTITSEISLRNFEGWSGARNTLATLTTEQLDTLENLLEDVYPEGMTDTQLNDILWFETDWIAEMLGFKDWETLDRYNQYGDTVKVEITDIKWDVDDDEDYDESPELPKEITEEFDEYNGDNDELEERISDWLSGVYGFCHDGFDYKIMEE